MMGRRKPVSEPAMATDRPVVAQIVTTLARGGAQATVLGSADMTEYGIDVVVLAGADVGDGDSLWGDPTLDGSRVIPVPGLVRSLSPLKDLRALLWLVGWLRANRPAVVHTHSSKAGVLGRLAAAVVGVPCAHTVHGWGPLYSSSRFAAAVATTIERLLARISRALVVVGEGDLQFGLQSRIGRPGDYRLIRSGIDIEVGATAARSRDAVRRELGLTDRFAIGMVARMAFQKDHPTLIAAFSRAAIPGAELVLVGDGPERTAIERLVAEHCLADRVHFLGSRVDGNRLVAAFDVAVLSSRWEGMPRSVVEAAAASVPVVASEVGSVGDLIDDEVSGRLVPVGDVAAMAAALVDAHDRPAAFQDMAAVAGRRVDEFSVDRMRRDLADLWLQLAGVRSPVSAVAQTEAGSALVALRSPEPEASVAPGAHGRGAKRRGRILAER